MYCFSMSYIFGQIQVSYLESITHIYWPKKGELKHPDNYDFLKYADFWKLI